MLAARHRRDRERSLALPEAFERPEATAPLVRQAMLAQGTSGVAALRGRELVGFLIGQRTDFPPDSTIAPYYRPASALVRYHAHAALAEGGWDIYRELYATAAELWSADELTAHYVQLPATDAIVVDAWASVGFGRDMGWGLRDTGLLEVAEPDDPVTIRRATPDDLEAVFQLDSALVRHEARSPVFMPYPTPAAEQEWRVDLRYSLRDASVAYWLAEQDGRPVGLLNVNPPPLHISPMLTPEGMVNIFAASVLPDLRGAGIGGVLLRHALDAARQAGHRWARMSWMTANLFSARFWSRHGFQPVAWRMARVVDERAVTNPSPNCHPEGTRP
ncbi:MAG: GNAT family N-acetyltransferase [Vicinamibacterales bacterium]